MDNNKKKVFNKRSVLTIITIVLAIVITNLLTSLYYKRFNVSTEDFSTINTVYSILDDKYYENVNKEELYESSIKGMVEGLDDPYSVYMTAEETADFKLALESQFVGIGVGLEDSSEGTYVSKVFDGSPAKAAGIEIGDYIVSVDGENMTEKTASDVAEFARGKEGTDVKFTVRRAGIDEDIEFELKRAAVQLSDLEYKMLDDEVGYIQIVDFTGSISSHFAEAFNNLTDEGMESLIIDVRNNGGGYLQEVVKIIDFFVDDSKPIYQEKVKDKIVHKEYGNAKKVDIPIAVVVNGGSASASELLTAALHEINNSEIVGTTTFGKGTAQTTQPLSDGSTLKYTFAQWLTPDGNWIHKVGVSPTVEVELNEIYGYRRVLVTKPLGINEVNPQILNAQRILNLLGYVGREDGYFDQGTEDTIRKFQTDNSLEVTGTLNTETANKLNELFMVYLDDYHNDNQITAAIEVLKGE